MEIDENSEVYRSSDSPSSNSIKVRCPQCLKLYSVDTAEIKDSKPKFQCVSCHTRFWLAYPESIGQGELVGFPLDWLESEQTPTTSTLKAPEQVKKVVDLEFTQGDKKDCPKCGHNQLIQNQECSSCEIIFEKFEKAQKTLTHISASSELKQRWEQVIQSYESEDLHQEFLRQCFRESNLEYASKKYNDILAASPQDEIALKLKRELEALILLEVDQPVTQSQTPSRRKYFSLLGFILMISLVIIALGFVMPSLRNLVGVGASILFFSLALRYYFKVL